VHLPLPKLANSLFIASLFHLSLFLSLHTFRYWKATMEYHRTKDILYVMQLLGHERIRNTLIYTQLVSLTTTITFQKSPKTLKRPANLWKQALNMCA
jgi:integrase